MALANQFDPERDPDRCGEFDNKDKAERDSALDSQQITEVHKGKAHNAINGKTRNLRFLYLDDFRAREQNICSKNGYGRYRAKFSKAKRRKMLHDNGDDDSREREEESPEDKQKFAAMFCKHRWSLTYVIRKQTQEGP
jgi:hypothetical protein